MAKAPLAQTLLITASRSKISIGEAVTVPSPAPTPTPTPSPTLSLSSAVAHAEGNSGTVDFVWTLTLNRDGSTASFPYSWAVTGNGSNPANAADFGGAFPSGSGTFAPGQTTKTITVLVSGDTAVEPSETFLLTVTAAGLNTVTSTGTISNDDSAGGEATPSYSGPALATQSSPTSYPPQPALATNAYHPVGSKLRVRAAPTYADLLAGTNLIVNDASFTLTGNATTNQSGLWSKLAGISSGKTFIDVRVEESSTVFSERSNPIMHGSASVPAPQASVNFSVYSTFPLSGAITFAEPVYLTIGGDDAINLQLSGTQPGTAFTLQWMDNGYRDYDPTKPSGNNDFNVDHVYDCVLNRRSLADQTAATTGAVTLLDYDTTPDAFSFTPVTGASQSALVPITSTALTGMADGYGAPLTLSGPWEKFQIDQGSGFGPELTSTSGVTIQDGWDIKVFIRASASYLGLARVVVTIGGVSANADVTVMADPAQPTLTESSTAFFSSSTDYSSGNKDLGTFAFGAGQRIIAFRSLGNRTFSSLTIGGAAAVQVAADTYGNQVWGVLTPTGAGSAAVVGTMTGGSASNFVVKAFTGTGLALPDSGSIQTEAPNYGRFTETVGAPMTINGSTGPGFVMAQVSVGMTGFAWTGATGFADATMMDDNNGQLNHMLCAVVPTTATPSVTLTTNAGYPFGNYFAFVFGKA